MTRQANKKLDLSTGGLCSLFADSTDSWQKKEWMVDEEEGV